MNIDEEIKHIILEIKEEMSKRLGFIYDPPDEKIIYGALMAEYIKLLRMKDK